MTKPTLLKGPDDAWGTRGTKQLSNHIQCDRCQHRMEYEDSIPNFCSQCGTPLTVNSSASDEKTVARKPANDMGEPPNEELTQAADRTRPISADDVKLEGLDSVGPYRLVSKLGQGGMGTVFEAQHNQNGRSVALKLLSAEVRGTDEMVQRFRRESQIAASINHPRSTFVYESGYHEGQLYITMELMDGGTLKDIVEQQGPLPVGRAVDYILDIIDGLSAAHNAGIVHRDLKPSNCFVDTEGRIKVGDFGLAKSFLGDSSLTQTGVFMGTPQYAAPEQIRNVGIDERTDIYALGGTLYFLLSGRPPFVGNPAQVISSIATETPTDLSKLAKAIPRSLVKLISQTLEKDPDRRPFHLNELRDQLLPFSTRGSVAAEPGRRMGAFFFDGFLLFTFGMIFISLSSPGLLFFLISLNVPLPPQMLGMFMFLTCSVSYFAISEARWGRTLGKWLFGLRVTAENSETPSFLIALGRTALVPGLMIILDHAISMIFLSNANAENGGATIFLAFEAQATGRFVVWGMLLALISTARKENGYRTVHDWLSGTRVVRLSGSLESQLFKHSAVVVPVVENLPDRWGEYQVLGQYRSDDAVQVFLGRDPDLDRSVWIFGGFSAAPLPAERRNVTRPNRLRIIHQAENDAGFWYSTDSVPGAAFADAIKNSACTWKSTAPLFRDIVYELAISEEKNLIPANLTVDHFWLDHSGRVRILDHALVTRSPETNEESAKSSRESAAESLVHLFSEYMQRHEHPVELIELADQLRHTPNRPDLFFWLKDRLNLMIERPSSFHWIDRVGMLAISFGIELSLISSIGLLLPLLLSGISAIWMGLGAALISFLIALALGYWGNPSMTLNDISLRQQHTKKEAATWKRMARSGIAWAPIIAALAVMIFLGASLSVEGEHLLDTASIVSNTIVVVAALLLAGVGVIWSLLQPARSLPDLILGTRLMKR